MMVALGAAAMSRRTGIGSLLAVALGSMNVAEGLTRYDPMYDAMGISTVEKMTSAPMQRAADKVTGAASEAVDRLAKRAEEYLT